MRRGLALRQSRVGAVVAVVTVAASLLFSASASAASSGAPHSSLVAHGSAEQVYVVGLAPHATASLLDGAGATLFTQRADSLGGSLFRGVPPGKAYRVRLDPGGQESAPVIVHGDDSAPWDPGVYGQPIPDSGYGYLTTRDGTKLAIDVRPPVTAGARPPYPTLVEYAGYGYADPAGPDSGIALLARLMGFAVVDVNMRGTGCSGGAFDYFEPLQNLDGYDVIETVARQPWVLDHKVGMMGISYGAISQLFTAQTEPPSLEAISPLSTIDNTQTTLYPGGVLNTGFAVPWAEQRQFDAKPAGPDTGQPWAYQRIQQGDHTCARNQALHGEATSVMARVRGSSHYVPSIDDPLSPITFVNKITVPVFMACQWEDEQTGGHCPDLAEHFTGTTEKWFTFTNGAHIDSLDPATFDRWYDFLELYVAHQAPAVHAAVIHAAAPIIYSTAMGITGVTLPSDPIQQFPTYSAALAAYTQLPPIRVLFDNGAGVSPSGTVTPGDPYAGFDASFTSFPIPGTIARSWFLGAGGVLEDQPPAGETIDRFTWDAGGVPLTDYTGSTGPGGLWGNAASWQWDWRQSPPGSSVSYLTAPLTADMTVIGAGAVHVWVRSSTPNVDLQATISEVRPDGMEAFVQDGWVRGDERKLDPLKSTLLEPVLSLRAADVQPMPTGRFVKVVIPLYFEGHVYRAGSRVRLTIAAPNGTEPVWSFDDTSPSGTAQESIGLSPTMRSSLILPIVPGVNVPTGLPPCPSLRNEPCRPYIG